jgi:hypothetical protein
MMRFPRLTGRGSEATIKRAVKHGWEGLTDVGSWVMVVFWSLNGY